ncbi:MAG: hypothetical protein JW882_01605, partial [Deltaproteobacteria bacterium]|nr:hypothetical protein [Deltaproteobacteria bacterium]
FDGYWQKGKPYLDAFEIIFIQDPVTSILAFESGAAQLIMRIEPKAAKDLQAKGYEILSITYGSKSLTPDGANADSPWSNRKAREALNYAIDRKAVSDAIGLGYWFPLYQAAPEGYIGHFTDVESFRYDPARAKKLLAEAGFPNGFSTTILSKAEENHDLLVAIQTYLSDIGIKAKIELLDRGRYVANHKEGWHNGIMYGTFGGRPSEEKASNLRIITTKMPYNKPVYSPPGFEETFDKAVGTWDPEEENRLTEKLYRMVYEESMIIPLWRETQLAAQTKNVHDSGWCAVASTAWYPENAWLSK